MITLKDVANNITVEEMAALSEPYEEEICAIVEGMLLVTPPIERVNMLLDLVTSAFALGRKLEMSRMPIVVTEAQPNEN